MQAKLERLMPRDLRVDKTYGRNSNEAHVARIAKNFDPNAMGVLIVNERHDGKRILIDGQHRVAALMNLKQGDSIVEALVFKGMSMREEAKLYASLNAQLPMNAADIFRAKVIAGDEEAVEINQMVLGAGFRVSNVGAPNSIRSPLTLRDALHLGVLKETLSVIDRGFPNRKVGPAALVLRAITQILHRYPTLDIKRLEKILQTQQMERWVSIARETARATGGHVSPTAVLLGLFTDAYNKALSANKRLKRVSRKEVGRYVRDRVPSATMVRGTPKNFKTRAGAVAS